MQGLKFIHPLVAASVLPEMYESKVVELQNIICTSCKVLAKGFSFH